MTARSNGPLARTQALWREGLRHLLVRPLDLSTETGRADERRRRVLLTASAGVAWILQAAALAIVTVPLTIGYLGSERYGLWVTISSVVAMMSFADLGIGNGLMTKVAEADGRTDPDRIRELAASAFFVLAVVAAIFGIALVALAPLVDWVWLLGVKTPTLRGEVRPVMVALTLTFLVSMPFAVVQRVQSGLQEGYATTLWSMAGTALSLVALIVATSLRAGLLPLVLTLAGIPVLVLVANFSWFFLLRRPRLRPRLRAFDLETASALLRTGLLYVVLQLAAAFAYASDNLVIARALGADAVPALAVPAKLFALLMLPVSLLVTPLWPAYGEAKARGDSTWVVRTLRRSVWASVTVAAGGGLVLVAFGGWIVRLWTRGAVAPGLDVLVPLALWTCLSAWGAATAAFLNGIDRIREQALAAVALAAGAFSLKWVFVAPLGPGGVVWATIGAYVMFVLIPIGLVAWMAQRDLGCVPGAGRGVEAETDGTSGVG